MMEMRRRELIYSVIVILVFLLAVYGKRILGYAVDFYAFSYAFNVVFSYLFKTIPVILTIGFLFGFKNIIKELRIHKGIIAGFSLSLITVSPMLISSAICGSINQDLDILELLRKTIFAGFFEELLFRGFLFGILFRKLGWGFLPASILGALVFGIGHLYQGSGLGESVGVFFVTAIGAVWFAWLFIEWDENLWVPIFLHVFMNLSWTLFDVGGSALGDFQTNIFRIITIAITVVVTIRKCMKRNYFNISANNLFKNRSSNA